MINIGADAFKQTSKLNTIIINYNQDSIDSLGFSDWQGFITRLEGVSFNKLDYGYIKNVSDMKLVKDLTTDKISPIIKLIGDEVVIVEAMDEYIELGAKAYDEIDGEVEVLVEGTVNTSILGTYTIYYQAIDCAGNVASETRTVKVLDTKKPVLTLNGDSHIILRQGENYTELGAKAFDTLDGDLTNSILVRGTVDTSLVDTYVLEYKVSDLSGNISKVTRTIEVKSNDKPIIQGVDYCEVYKGELFNPYEGVSVFDFEDGDLTNQLTIKGVVDINKIGEYKIVYSVTDNDDNTVSVTRVIKIKPQIGDLNGDGIINQLDLDQLSNYYNVYQESDIYKIEYDINQDGIIDLYDFVSIAKFIEINN